MRFIYLILTLFLAHSTYAANLKNEKIEGFFEGVKLIKEVSFQNDDKSQKKMSSVSYGLQKVPIYGLVPVNVYVMQFLANRPEKLVKTEDGLLASLKEAGPIHIHLTFLRSLPGEKISSTFREEIEANKIKVKHFSDGLNQILSEIASIPNLKIGDVLSITVNWSQDSANIYLTGTSLNFKMISGDKLFAEQLMSIWFGKSAESRLDELKKL